MTKQMLRGIRVNSKEELVQRIYMYFDEINDDPVVYHGNILKYSGKACKTNRIKVKQGAYYTTTTPFLKEP